MTTSIDRSAPNAMDLATDWQVRKDLAACYRLVHHFRMTDLIATHISARLPGARNAISDQPFRLPFQRSYRK